MFKVMATTEASPSATRAPVRCTWGRRIACTPFFCTAVDRTKVKGYRTFGDNDGDRIFTDFSGAFQSDGYVQGTHDEAMGTALDEAERVASGQKLAFSTDVYCPLTRACWLLRLERLPEAESKFRDVLPIWAGAGLAIGLPHFKALHAEALLRLGMLGAALEVVSGALEQVERPGWGEQHSLSEILRVKACVLDQMGNLRGAEDVFRQALHAAREQHASSLELRPAASYARSLKNWGRADETQALLRPVYSRFTEGHDTKDLKDAIALLRGLE